MKIILTGGTGYIGTSLARQLRERGHTVTTLVRSTESATKATEGGAQAVVGSLFDQDWVAEQFATGDAVLNLAAGGDASDEKLGRVATAAAVSALGGTAKPYVHTGGIWVYGSGSDITEQSPLAPPALTAWRPAVERIVLDADVAATVIQPGIVYGYGTGIPAAALGARTETGQVSLVGSGDQHWSTVHADDVAALYALVAERGEALGNLIAVSGDNPTVREMGVALAGSAGVASETDDQSRARLGALFADALLLDQQSAGARARSLGWTPKAPTLVEELGNGSYTTP
jgi:nucleoside-diphosphate-sugar epimerase